MKSMKLQLLVALAAVAVAAGMLAWLGPLPGESLLASTDDGHWAEARRALRWGVAANVKDTGFGFTPLHHAAKGLEPEAAEVVALLLARGADVHAPAGGGLGIVDMDYPIQPLHMAARADVARMLVAAGADVNAETHWGSRPLNWAISYGNAATRAELVEALVSLGARVNDPDGVYSPLHLAVKSRAPDVAAVLLKNGARVDARDSEGLTPLDLVVGGVTPSEIGKLLRQYGAKE